MFFWFRVCGLRFEFWVSRFIRFRVWSLRSRVWVRLLWPLGSRVRVAGVWLGVGLR